MTRAGLVPLILVLTTAPLAAQAPQPVTGPPPRLGLPRVEKALLPNGLRLDVVSMREIPVVQATLIVDGGGRLDGARPGLASFTASMLDEGAGSLDALQLSAKYRVATPANWQPGDDTVVLPFISDDEAERMFADQGGFRKVRSYLRFVRDPSLRVL